MEALTTKGTVKSIIKYTIGDATITKLEEAVTKLVDEGELIKHNDRYTTLALLQKEKEILKIAKKSLNSCKPLLKESYFKKECKKFEDRQASLNKGKPHLIINLWVFRTYALTEI